MGYLVRRFRSRRSGTAIQESAQALQVRHSDLPFPYYSLAGFGRAEDSKGIHSGDDFDSVHETVLRQVCNIRLPTRHAGKSASCNWASNSIPSTILFGNTSTHRPGVSRHNGGAREFNVVQQRCGGGPNRPLEFRGVTA